MEKPIVARFSALSKLRKPIYVHSFALIKAICGGLEQKGIESRSAATYLTALLEIREVYYKSGKSKLEQNRLHEAYTFTLSSLISMVPIAHIQHHFSTILDFLNAQLASPCKDITICVKYAVVCYQFLLHSRTAQHWTDGDATTLEIFGKIVEFGLDSREKVRMQAIRSFVILSSNQQKDLLVKGFTEFEKFAISTLEAAKTKLTNRAEQMLNFLSCTL